MSALEGLGERPAAFLRSGWPWRSAAFLAASVLPGAVAVACGLLAAAVWWPLAAVVVAAVPVAWRFERWRTGLVDAAPAVPDGRGRQWALGAVVLLALWWVDLVMLAVAVAGPVVLVLSPWLQPDAGPAVAGAVVGVLLLPVAMYVITAWAGARAVMTRAILTARGSELEEVRRSRARLVDAYELERRRIERDLHDGAQQRLVALTMRLGLARLDHPDADEVLGEAQAEARRALEELRELVSGVHSRVLTDRGLGAAVEELADRSLIPINVEISLERLPGPVEVAAFYVVSEALANVAKHSGAESAAVRARVDNGVLVLEIEDDGVGGAVPGGGLTGLADRVSVVEGRLSLSSPAGGPTLIRVEIPCA